jgi:hypothetical protein
MGFLPVILMGDNSCNVARVQHVLKLKFVLSFVSSYPIIIVSTYMSIAIAFYQVMYYD